jgi:hypothetical protein
MLKSKNALRVKWRSFKETSWSVAQDYSRERRDESER